MSTVLFRQLIEVTFDEFDVQKKPRIEVTFDEFDFQKKLRVVVD